jgi:hypothetical protein
MLGVNQIYLEYINLSPRRNQIIIFLPYHKAIQMKRGQRTKVVSLGCDSCSHQTLQAPCFHQVAFKISAASFS